MLSNHPPVQCALHEDQAAGTPVRPFAVIDDQGACPAPCKPAGKSASRPRPSGSTVSPILVKSSGTQQRMVEWMGHGPCYSASSYLSQRLSERERHREYRSTSPACQLKVRLHENFVLNWFGQKNPSELLINHLKYFRFCLRIRRDIRIFVHSAYYQNTEIFLPRIIRIRKFSFRVLSVYIQFHSTYYLLTLSFSRNGKYILCILTIS